jgi:hypothetical protein
MLVGLLITYWESCRICGGGGRLSAPITVWRRVISSIIGQGKSIASYTLTPLVFCGLSGFYTMFRLDLLLGCTAAAYPVYLLYLRASLLRKFQASAVSCLPTRWLG